MPVFTRMNPHTLATLTLLTCVVVFHGSAKGEDSWKEFRGNMGNGLALEANLPTQWTTQTNCDWTTKIHGRGWSSPVVVGDEVWLTTATKDGRKMSVLCVALSNGSILHDKLIFENESVQEDYHPTNSYASSTPVINGDKIYVHFGSYGTACIERSSCKVVWTRRDLPCNHYRGAGSSPIIFDDLLIFHMDGFDHQYAVALDKSTGMNVWKKDREIDYGTDNGDFYKAFSTPMIIQANGESQLISPASKSCLALNPKTGEEIWRVRYDEHSTTVRPLFDGKRVYLSTGFGKAKMMCVRVDGKGDVTDTHVDWVQTKSIGSKPSPVLIAGRLFDVTDSGVFERIDVETGEIVWKQRLGGKFSSSLVANKDFVFAFDHDGKGYVFSNEDEPKLIATNTLPNGCNASPAIAGNSLIVRTTKSLYRFSVAK